MREPMPHQQRVLKWAEGRDHPAFLLEPRLGKTLIAIRWAMQFSPERVLVVCPLSVVDVWKQELELEGQGCVSLVGRKIDGAGAWHLINFEGLFARDGRKAVPAALVQMPWDVVIVDESTRARNPRAKITQLLMHNFRDARRAILTGTPNPESPMDFFCQMRFLLGRFMGCTNYFSFRDTYFQQGFSPWDWQPKKGAVQEIREAVRQVGYVLSRKDAGILPPVSKQIRYVELPKMAWKAYKTALKDFEVGEQMTKYAIVVATWLAQIAGGCAHETVTHAAKRDELKELLTGEFQGEQVVVWYRFNAELRACYEDLRAAGVGCSQIVGATPIAKRDERIRRFQAGKTRVLLVQTACAQFGLNLSAANISIRFSRWWSSLINIQSDDRIIHPKKTKSLLMVDLVARDTIDEEVLEALREKKMTARMFITRWMKGRERGSKKV